MCGFACVAGQSDTFLHPQCALPSISRRAVRPGPNAPVIRSMSGKTQSHYFRRVANGLHAADGQFHGHDVGGADFGDGGVPCCRSSKGVTPGPTDAGNLGVPKFAWRDEFATLPRTPDIPGHPGARRGQR
jgi:hypothetical protein